MIDSGLGKDIEMSWGSLDTWKWPYKTIGGGGQITTIYLIYTPWFTVSLNRFNFGDHTPFLHDHPWHFFSIMLWGEYTEEINRAPWETDETRSHRRRWLSGHRMKRNWAHQVREVHPKRKAFTILFTGKPVRNSITFWGDKQRQPWKTVREAVRESIDPNWRKA